MKNILFLLTAFLVSMYSQLTFAQTTPSVVFTYSVNGTISPVTPTLTWSSSGASACSASSTPSDPLWTGTVALSGSKTVTAITTQTVYNITCSTASDTTATLSWTPPTTNTDGTALTNLAGFKAYEVVNGSNVLKTDLPLPSYTQVAISSLAIGTHTFVVTAYNALGTESGPSNQASKTIVAAASTTQSVTVPVQKKPSPPQTLTAK